MFNQSQPKFLNTPAPYIIIHFPLHAGNFSWQMRWATQVELKLPHTSYSGASRHFLPQQRRTRRHLSIFARHSAGNAKTAKWIDPRVAHMYRYRRRVSIPVGGRSPGAFDRVQTGAGEIEKNLQHLWRWRVATRMIYRWADYLWRRSTAGSNRRRALITARARDEWIHK